MEENSDNEMDDFMEGIDDELQEERDQSPSRQNKTPSESDSTIKLLILAAVGVLVLIVLMVILFTGSGGLSKEDLAPMEARLNQLENRLKTLEPLAERMETIDKRTKGIERSLASLRRSNSALKKQITAVNLKMGKQQKTGVPAPSKSKSRYHTVRRGDTLYSISKKYSVTIDDLLKLNKMKKGQELKIGQKVLLPPTSP